MILTDGTHLVSDRSFHELHSFAASLSIPPHWFQRHRIPHYDLLGPRRPVQALGAGALAVSTRELVCRAIRKE